ncbi:SRPBCC family protein [Paenibacillus sp. P96]|uniref:SRPBCC family protein n=1 Tax=Paenibacillus zeirhizosphaerae TaxID=2987519 RepID=A0ABT9FN17_9BACL|nr:SRPBCC family protein [Paenibacillus sp. P96]MDP4096122.1 SRPBCC family protein [Paenibacillus sp. P96]
MPLIRHDTYIEAPINVCFDLVRDVEIHTKTTSKTKEKAVGGVTKGLLKEGDTVTWEAIHFGIKQRLTAKVVEMEIPHKLTDVMVKGAFRSFTHTHAFLEHGQGTIMKDTFEYRSPFGVIGKVVDRLFLEKYMQRFIIDRANELKKLAEEIS